MLFQYRLFLRSCIWHCKMQLKNRPCRYAIGNWHSAVLRFVLKEGCNDEYKCRKLKRFLNKFKNIMMFFLPPYSPEYNPVEQVWQWTKENICFRKTPLDCIGSLKRQIKKLFYHRKYGKPGTDLNVGWYMEIISLY